MNLVQSNFIQHQLANRVYQINRVAEGMEWVTRNRPILNLAEMLPPIGTEAGQKALARYELLIAGLGMDIHKERLWGTIGEVGWAGNEATADEMLATLPLLEVASSAFTALFVGGITAAVAYPYQTPAGEMQNRLDVLVGYLEPIYPDNNADYVSKLLQVKRELDGNSWQVDLYDYDNAIWQTWRDIADPSDYSSQRPSTEQSLDYPPRFVMAGRDAGGLPVGEVVEGIPLLRSEIIKQIKLERLEDDHAFPMIGAYGVNSINQLGPNVVIDGPVGSKVERIAPGDLSTAQEQHDRLLERIRRRFAGRVQFGGTSRPAEGTIVEANQLSISAYEYYARLLSRLLTQTVEDYAVLVNAKPVPVQVKPNKAAYKAQAIAEMSQLYKDGLISLDMAVGEIRNYYDFTEEQIQKFLDSKSTVNSGDIARLLGGGNQ